MADNQVNKAALLAEKLLQKLGGGKKRQKLIDDLSKVGVELLETRSNASLSDKDCKSKTSESSVVAHMEDDVIVISDSDSDNEQDGSKSGSERSDEELSSTEETASDEEEEANDARDLTLPKNVGSESEVESEDEWELVKIDDDDNTQNRAPKEMVCMRCPNKTTGTFKDKDKFWIHIKRHTFGNHFTCPTCRRPFIKLSYCISHEIRVHGTKLEYDNRDPVISTAKAYVRKTELTKKNPEATQNAQNNTLETDDETDCEDPKFYDNLVVSSTSLYPYRGPEVKTILESYEIQINHARQKYSRSNVISRIALDVHEYNVGKGYNLHTIGRFSKKKPSKKKLKTKSKAKNKKSTNKNITRPSSSGNGKRQAEAAIGKSEQPKTKRRKVTYKYMTSSSSSSSSSEEDNSEDVDYVPGTDKKETFETDAEIDATNRNCSQRKPLRKKAPPDTSTGGTKIKFLSGIINRVCQQCNYMWTDERDLRVHRDAMHPNLPLAELMHVYKSKSKSAKKALNTDACPGVAPKKQGSGILLNGQELSGRTVGGKKGSKSKTTGKASNKKDAEKKQKKKTKSKSKSVKQRLHLVPDSSYTDKERFMHALGLTNRIRLHLRLKKPVNDLNLPECFVKLERLNPQLVQPSFKLWFQEPLWELVT